MRTTTTIDEFWVLESPEVYPNWEEVDLDDDSPASAGDRKAPGSEQRTARNRPGRGH